MRRILLPIFSLVPILLVTACISAPPETLELADVVAEQSASLETAHRNAIRLYFNELEKRIDSFVDNEWTPDFLNRALQNAAVQESLEGVQAGLSIDPDLLRSKVSSSDDFSDMEVLIIVDALEAAQFDYRVQFGEIMIAFSEAALRQIEKIRQELKEPLKKHQLELMASLDEGYANLNQGQATLRAYLESVVELVEQQDRILKKLDLIKLRDDAMDAIVDASDKAANAADRIDAAGNIIENLVSNDDDGNTDN